MKPQGAKRTRPGNRGDICTCRLDATLATLSHHRHSHSGSATDGLRSGRNGAALAAASRGTAPDASFSSAAAARSRSGRAAAMRGGAAVERWYPVTGVVVTSPQVRGGLRRAAPPNSGGWRGSSLSMTRRMLPMATVTPPIRAEQGSRRRDRDAPDEGRASVGRRGVRRRLRLQRSRSRGGRIPRRTATWWTVRPRSRSSQRTCPAVASGDNSGWVKAQLLLRNGQPIRRRWIHVKGSGDVGLAWLSHRTKEQALWLRSHRCNESARVRLLLLAPRPGLGPDVRSEWCRGVPAGGRPGHVVGFGAVRLPRQRRLGVRVVVDVAAAQFILFGRCGVGVGRRRLVFLAAIAASSGKARARAGSRLLP